MSRSASDVSVVTVNWNGREHLASLLPTLAPLGCREVIVVDNGSQDGSLEFLRSRHPDVKLVRNSANLGFAHPCNQGAREAQGRFVAFINNDMRVHPGWISEALTKVSPSIPCVASRILDWEGERVDFNGASLQYLGFALQRDIGELARELTHEDRILFPCGGAMLVDRQVFLDLGGFDPDFFAIFEDVDFGWRLWLSGREVAFAPTSLAYHRGHATFQRHHDARRRYLMHRNALMAVIKNYDDQHLRQILPLAFRLTVKRAVLLSGARKESFHLWASASQELRSGDPRVQDRWIDALNHLVALDDVLEGLPGLLEKRAAVQALRKRPDQEISTLFGDPLRSIVDDPAYRVEEASWMRMLGFDLFPIGNPCRDEARLETASQKRLKEIRKEMAALQWIGADSRGNPPTPPRPTLSGVWRSLRRNGLRAAWRRAAGRVRSGS